jgi:LysM repeat protein
MKRGRYVDLFCLDKTDYKSWAYGLKKDGYATDPEYAGRLIHLIESNKLEAFDTVVDYNIFIAQFEGDKPEIFEQNGTEPDNMYASQDVFSFNNIKTIIARPGDVPLQVALHFDISLNRLYKYNDMYEGDLFNAGEKVYLQPKRSKGDVEYHTVKDGETMRSISQDHGIRLAKLYERNKLKPGEQPAVGERVYLKKTRENAPKIAQPEESPVVKSSTALPKNDNMSGAVATLEKGDLSGSNNPANNDKTEVMNFDKSAEPSFQYYMVKTGDTLYSISRTQGVTIQQLKQLNSLAADKISIGQLIKVPTQ